MKDDGLLAQIMQEKERFAAKHGFDVRRIAAASRAFARQYPLKPTKQTMHLRPGTSPLRSLMVDDEIVAEVRRVREELFEKAGGTLSAFMEAARTFARENPLLPPTKSRKMIPGYAGEDSEADSMPAQKPRGKTAAQKAKHSAPFRAPKPTKQRHR